MMEAITASDIIEENNIQAQPTSIDDLAFAIDWLGGFEPQDDDEPTLQAIANVRAFLTNEINRRNKLAVIAQAKREYAKANGIKVSQVRVKK